MFKRVPHKLDAVTVDRLSAVLLKAIRFGDTGVVEWVDRAVADTEHLGRLRERDAVNLNRLESTYAASFYNAAMA